MGHPSLSIGEDAHSRARFFARSTPQNSGPRIRRAPLTKMSAMAGSSRGDFETQQLRANVEEQLQRLLTQLEDLDELRDERRAAATARHRAASPAYSETWA